MNGILDIGVYVTDKTTGTGRDLKTNRPKNPTQQSKTKSCVVTIKNDGK